MFNLVLAVIALPFVGVLTSLLTRLMPDKASEDNPLAEVSALDPNALERPQRGLDCAARELLGMGQKIEHMLISVEPLYDTWNGTAAKTIRNQDPTIKQVHLDVKLYLAKLGQTGLDEEFGHRSMELASIPRLMRLRGSCWNWPNGSRQTSCSFHRKVGPKLATFPTGFRATCNWH